MIIIAGAIDHFLKLWSILSCARRPCFDIFGDEDPALLGAICNCLLALIRDR
jgi:hypothetical protein